MQKLNEMKKLLESKGYTCKKNSFPIFLPKDGRWSLIDLACFQAHHHPIGIELESKNTQQLRNLEGLKEFKRTYPSSNVCQIFADDTLSKCDLQDLQDL